MLSGRLTALAGTVVAAAVVALLASAGPSAIGSTRTACPPKSATKVFSRSKFGSVFRRRDDGVGLRSCSSAGRSFYEGMSSTDSQPQVESIDIGGRFYAYAVAVCDTDNPCLTNIRTFALGGCCLRPALTMLPAAAPVSNQVYVTQLRIAANQALSWIVCEGGPFGRAPSACLRDGRRRWLYARPASQAFEDVEPTLVATGRHLDARYLKLSSDGTKVTWRQSGQLRSEGIGP